MLTSSSRFQFQVSINHTPARFHQNSIIFTDMMWQPNNFHVGFLIGFCNFYPWAVPEKSERGSSPCPLLQLPLPSRGEMLFLLKCPLIMIHMPWWVEQCVQTDRYNYSLYNKLLPQLILVVGHMFCDVLKINWRTIDIIMFLPRYK